MKQLRKSIRVDLTPASTPVPSEAAMLIEQPVSNSCASSAHKTRHRLLYARVTARASNGLDLARQRVVDRQCRRDLTTLTILGLARKLGREITREPITSPSKARTRLKSLVRYKPFSLEHAWALGNTKNKGVETRSYQFLFANGLSAAGVLAKAITAQDGSPVTIVLNDKGKKAAASTLSDRLNRGEQVLAVDLLFTGDAAPKQEDFEEFPLLLATTGERALGVEAAQLIALAQWMRKNSGAQNIRVDSTGIRNQVAALIAVDLEPGLFSQINVHEGMRTMKYLLDAPIKFEAAPDLFCLDLLREFDVDRLAALAAPVDVIQQYQ